MLVILGYLVVLGAVFGGYLLVGGHLGALYQPAEFLIIGGAGIGAFIVGNNGKAIKSTLRALPKMVRRSKYSKALYMDLMALLFLLLAKSRQQGMLSLEFDIDNPQESEIFANYPRILADNHLVEFITDYLRLMVSGNMNAFEIEALMDEEIETFEQESEVPAGSLAMVGDSLPAFGIVAAVMGWCTRWPRRTVRRQSSGRLSPTRWWGLSSAFCWPMDLSRHYPRCCGKKRRDRQDDAVHQGDVALQPQRLRAANRRRIWPQNVIHHRAPVVCRA